MALQQMLNGFNAPITSENWLNRLFPSSSAPFGFLGTQSSDLEHELERMVSSYRGEVEENDKEILLKCILPGVPKEDVKVDISGNLLTMKVKKDEEAGGKTDEGMEWHRKQMQNVVKSWRLPQNVDQKGIKADTKHGILTIRLPKVKAKEDSKRITVKGE